MNSSSKGTTLVELLVACGILSLVLVAVISFYIEASAVSTKRNQQSERLRRFHLGLDKIEQALADGRLLDATSDSLILYKLDELAEKDGLPSYSTLPLQLLSKSDGVHELFGQDDKLILPLKSGERLSFDWLRETNLPDLPRCTVLGVTLHYIGAGDRRSDLYLRRAINLDYYDGRPPSLKKPKPDDPSTFPEGYPTPSAYPTTP